MTSHSPQPNLFASFFIFLTLPALHMPSHCWDRSNTIHFCRQRGQYPLSVLPLNQCIPSAGSLCRKRAGSNSKCFFQLPRLIVSSWRQYPVERTPFFSPHPHLPSAQWLGCRPKCNSWSPRGAATLHPGKPTAESTSRITGQQTTWKGLSQTNVYIMNPMFPPS